MSSSKAILEGATIDARVGGSLIYHVSNLDGTTHQMMAQALETAGIPQYNDPHPFITGLKVTGGPRVIEVPGNFCCRVQVDYGPDETIDQTTGGAAAEYSLDTRIAEEETIFDAAGAIIQVRFNLAVPARAGLNAVQNADGSWTPSGASNPEKLQQAGKARRYVPLSVFRVTRTENILRVVSHAEDVGATNATNFMFQTPGYWLWASLSQSSADRGKTYQTTYEFWGQKYGWTQGVLYTMEDGRYAPVSPKPSRDPGKPFRIATAGGELSLSGEQSYFNGMTLVNVQQEIDFDFLNIPVPPRTDV